MTNLNVARSELRLHILHFLSCTSEHISFQKDNFEETATKKNFTLKRLKMGTDDIKRN